MVDAVTGRPVQADGQKVPSPKKNAVKVEFVADERTKAERAAVDQVGRAIEDMRRSRKSAAADKVAYLKKQMELLRLLGAANPQATARELARLVKELGGAAQSYAGTGIEGAAEAVAVAGATQPASADAPSDTPPAPEQQRQAVVETVMKAYGQNQALFDKQQAEAKFALDVRSLFEQAKAMLEELRRRVGRDRKDLDVEAAAKAVAEAGDTIDQALGQDQVGMPVVPGIPVIA